MSATSQQGARARAESPKPAPKTDEEKRVQMTKQVPLLPQLLWSVWNNYDKEELAHHERVTYIDRVGLCVLTVCYAALVFWVAPTSDIGGVPFVIQCLQLLFTMIAVFNLHLQNHALVKPSKSCPAEYFVTDGPLGRFIWMTHQIINLVSVHFILSIGAPFVSSRLVAGTYIAAIPIGGLAVFATVQFFLLVYPLDETAKEYQVWAGRGVHMKFIDILRHILPGILALADVLLLKRRSTLLTLVPSIVMLLFINMIYATAYLIWTRVNFKITKQWPYGFLNGLGLGMLAWVQFGAIQCAILSTFAVVLSLLVRWLPASW